MALGEGRALSSNCRANFLINRPCCSCSCVPSCHLWLQRENIPSTPPPMSSSAGRTPGFPITSDSGFPPLPSALFLALPLPPLLSPPPLSSHFPVPTPIPRDTFGSLKALKSGKDYNATPIYGSKLRSKLMCMLKWDLHLSLFSHRKILGKLTEAELFFLFWCVWGWAVYQFPGLS